MKKVLLLIALIMGMSQTAFASFPDVPSDHENAEAIAWLKLEGVVQGYPDGTFKPDNQINRAEFLKMLYETIGMEGHDPVLSFPDVPANEWYTKYVKEAFYTKVAVGYPDGYFRPENNINFVEAVKVVMNGFFDVDDLYGAGDEYTPCDEDLREYDGIDTGEWYWKYLYVADERCILDFGHAAIGVWGLDPSMFITRADMAELLYRAHNQKEDEMVEGDEGGEEADAGDTDGEEADSDGGGDVAVAGDGDGDGKVLNFYSTDFVDGGTIPVDYTCDSDTAILGFTVPPSIYWTNVPENAKSVAAIIDDPDAPGGIFYHALFWGLPAQDGQVVFPSLPEGIIFGTNSFGNTTYDGPCPPEGDDPHAYHFKLFALDIELALEEGASPEAFYSAIEGHIVEQDSFVGYYEKK